MVHPTVYIVDDDVGVRDSLALLLELKGYRAMAFGSAEAFLRALDPGSTGCAIIDLRMPGMDGAALQREMRRRSITMPVIIITAHGDVSAARNTLKAGAVDFIEKPIDDDQLVAAINLALERAAEQSVNAVCAVELRARVDRLTRRERQVMDLVVAGRHNREIAAELDISPRTVEVYKARLMEKLQVQRIPDLVRLVIAARSGDDR